MADNQDTGTNPPVKTLETTQATSPNVPPGVANGENIESLRLRINPENGQLYDPGPAGVATINPGAGVYDDGTTTDIQNEIDRINAGEKGIVKGQIDENAGIAQIATQPNILDKFSSYTYRASLYLVTPEQYNALLYNKKKNVSGYQLLIQSGGAPANADGFRGSSAVANTTDTVAQSSIADAGRNPAFPQDFYFESITIENVFPGRGTNMAHAAANLRFTIVEPMGITLVDRLYQAVQDFVPKNGAAAINYAAVTYLMVIRFYGYDAAGNLVTKIGNPNSSDPNAVIEKFIPFRLTKLDFSVNGKASVYSVEGAPVGLMVAAGTRRGTIPHDVQPTARTVGDLLGGNSVYSTPAVDPQNPGATTAPLSEDEARDSEGSSNPPAAPPPPKADSAPTTKKTISSGVLNAMNDFQRELITGKNKIFKEPDTYNIVWVADENGAQPIRDATITLPGSKQPAAETGMAPPATSDVKSATPSRVAKDTSSRNFSITAGMQLVQVIDLAIRNSSYVLSQALTIIDPDTGMEKENPEKRGQPVKWYNIEFEAKPKAYDELRSDHAFDITFYIKPYTIQAYNSKYFPMTKFRGVHKSYQYWFTGQNTSVLSYEEKLNTLYHITVTGSNPSHSLAEKQRRELTSSMREIPFYSYQAASTESRAGTDNKTFEVSANLAEDLYSPSDLAEANIKIIGDPAWIQQGQFAGGVDTTSLGYNPFLPDGTINFDSGQVLFEIAWQRPQDYDLTTGVADPYSNRKNSSREPGQSRVYIATKCVSEFNQGKFTQDIKGGLYLFLKPNKKNKAVTAAPPATQADVRRVDNAVDAQTATGQESQPSPSRVSNSDNETTVSAATTGANNSALRPAPDTTQPSVEENNTPGQTPPAPAIVKMAPPQPPEDGSGTPVGTAQEQAIPITPKINLSAEAVPTGPQDAALET